MAKESGRSYEIGMAIKWKGRKEKIKRRIKRGKEKGGERKYEVRELNSTQFEYLNFRSNLSISYHSH